MSQVVQPNQAANAVSEVLLCLRSLVRLFIARLRQFLEMEYYYESLNLPMMSNNMMFGTAFLAAASVNISI